MHLDYTLSLLGTLLLKCEGAMTIKAKDVTPEMLGRLREREPKYGDDTFVVRLMKCRMRGCDHFARLGISDETPSCSIHTSLHMQWIGSVYQGRYGTPFLYYKPPFAVRR